MPSKINIIQGTLGTPCISAFDSLQHIYLLYAVNLIYAIYTYIYAIYVVYAVCYIYLSMCKAMQMLVDSIQIVEHQVILSVYLGSKDLSEIKIVWSII